MSEPPLPPATQARVLVPFVIVTLIWSSTWIVIRDQLGVVPPTWSVAYRFVVAAAAMFAYVLWTRASLRLSREAMLLAAVIGVSQFVLNFNFVYRAEAYVTSGLVAVIFALLVVPNALLGWLFLHQGVSRRFFLGSAVAIAGVALLFAHEIGAAAGRPKAVALGIGLTLLGVLSASVANVLQASERVKRLPIAPVLAWAMLIGGLANALWAAITSGPPVVDWRWGYLAGVLYLGVLGSTLSFTLYYGVIRAIGPARAAYSSVLVPVLAMALSTLFEGYRWTLTAAVGGALVLLGLVIALRARSPAR